MAIATKDRRPKEVEKATKKLYAAKRLSGDEVYDSLCWNRDQLLIAMRRYIADSNYDEAKKIKSLLNHAIHAVDRYEETHKTTATSERKALSFLIPGIDYDIEENKSEDVN